MKNLTIHPPAFHIFKQAHANRSAKENLNPNIRRRPSKARHRTNSLQIKPVKKQSLPMETLTFGNWKEPHQQLELGAHLATLEVSQQNKQSKRRLRQYEEMKIKKVSQSERYRPKPLFPTNNIIIQRFCVDPEKARLSLDPAESESKNSISRGSRGSRHFSRKCHFPEYLEEEGGGNQGVFKEVYLRQKEKFERLLRKYNIEEKDEGGSTAFFG